MTMPDKLPFRVGDRVRGLSYVPPERRNREEAELFEGVVVQVGSGYAGVDAQFAFIWARLADCTERQSLVQDTELVERTHQIHQSRSR